MTKWYLFILAALIAGFGFGSVLGPVHRADKNEDEPKVAEVVVDQAAVETAALNAAALAEAKAKNDALLSEIAALNAALDNSRLEISQHVAELDKLRASVDKPKSPVARTSRETWQERTERMKKEQPEQFAQMEKQREEFKKRMDSVVADKASFLLSIDTTDMTEAEKKGHEELQTRLAETWDVMNKMQEGQPPKGEDVAKMMENYAAMQELYAQERDYALRQVGKNIGYNEQESVEFSSYIKDVFEKTSPNPPRSAFSGFSGFGQRGGRSSRQTQPKGADVVK